MALKACLVASFVSLYFHFNPDCLWHSDHHLLSVFKLLPSTFFFLAGALAMLLILYFTTYCPTHCMSCIKCLIACLPCLRHCYPSCMWDAQSEPCLVCCWSVFSSFVSCWGWWSWLQVKFPAGPNKSILTFKVFLPHGGDPQVTLHSNQCYWSAWMWQTDSSANHFPMFASPFQALPMGS